MIIILWVVLGVGAGWGIAWLFTGHRSPLRKFWGWLRKRRPRTTIALISVLIFVLALGFVLEQIWEVLFEDVMHEY